jgi:hypothetical protein
MSSINFHPTQDNAHFLSDMPQSNPTQNEQTVKIHLTATLSLSLQASSSPALPTKIKAKQTLKRKFDDFEITPLPKEKRTNSQWSKEENNSLKLLLTKTYGEQSVFSLKKTEGSWKKFTELLNSMTSSKKTSKQVYKKVRDMFVNKGNTPFKELLKEKQDSSPTVKFTFPTIDFEVHSYLQQAFLPEELLKNTPSPTTHTPVETSIVSPTENPPLVTPEQNSLFASCINSFLEGLYSGKEKYMTSSEKKHTNTIIPTTPNIPSIDLNKVSMLSLEEQSFSLGYNTAIKQLNSIFSIDHPESSYPSLITYTSAFYEAKREYEKNIENNTLDFDTYFSSKGLFSLDNISTVTPKEQAYILAYNFFIRELKKQPFPEENIDGLFQRWTEHNEKLPPQDLKVLNTSLKEDALESNIYEENFDFLEGIELDG